MQGGRPRRGLDVRCILVDKLATTALLSWVKELQKSLASMNIRDSDDGIVHVPEGEQFEW